MMKRGNLMKKVLILSDTHMPKKGSALPDPVLSILKDGVDYIIHAGDWTERAVYDELVRWAPVHGVKGNIETDNWAIELPEKKIVEIEKIKVAIVHGHLGKGKSTPDRAFRACFEDEVDLIVFGHSHIPHKEKRNGVLLFNPGSPTDKRRETQFSYGILTIDSNRFEINHSYFS
jgi:uncharacterized protein